MQQLNTNLWIRSFQGYRVQGHAMNVDPGFAYNSTTQTYDDLNPSMLQPYPHHQYQRKHHLPPLLRSFLKLQSHLQSALGLEGITRTCFLYKIILNGFVNILWFKKLYRLKNFLSFANPDSTLKSTSQRQREFMITFLGDQGQLRVMLDFCGFLKSTTSHRRSTGKIIPKQGLVIEPQQVEWDHDLAST